MLSEESKRKRRRTDTISLQTTIISWLIEFIAGSAMLISYLLSIFDEGLFIRFYIPFDIILCSIIIPSCYILKTEKIKKVVADGGWCKIFKDIFPFSNMRVLPAENLEIGNICNDHRMGNNAAPEQEDNQQPEQQIKEDDENWWMKIDLFDEYSIESVVKTN